MENNQPVNYQPLPDTTPTSQRNNLLIPLTIGGIILLLLVGTGSYYLGQRSEKQKIVSMISPTTIIQPTSIPTPTLMVNNITPTTSAFDTTNWKKYFNDKYHFILRYPTDWKYLEVPTSDYAVKDDGVWFTNGSFPPPQTDARAPLSIYLANQDPTSNWKPETYNNYKIEPYSLGNISAQKISGMSKESGFQVDVVIAKIGDFYFVAQPASEQSTTLEYFNAILSTFNYLP